MRALLLSLTAYVLMNTTPSPAEEGMWTFDNLPLQRLQGRYGFTPTEAWLDHVRLASVRFEDGGSGSFVSAGGLVLTNHHVALGQLQKVSNSAMDYVKSGFYARTAAEELKCPDLELNVLVSMENVTARIQRAVKAGMSEEEGLKARKAEIAKVEKDSTDSTGLRSEVVTLYQGGEYWLYRYKKYTDVRLVFAPEQQIAFFGGDNDNFTYPRYDLDMALFRVYENNQPVHPKEYLKWNRAGAGAGELVFVSGNPGSTSRQQTMAEIEMERDHVLPLVLKIYSRRLEVAQRYAAQGPEQNRQAGRQIFGLMNSLKAFRGMYQGLLDKDLIAKKQKEETDFRRLVASRPEWQKEYGSAWDAIAQAEKNYLGMVKTRRFYSPRWSRLMDMALTIVQYVSEIKKADGVRLEGYHDSQLESLKFRLFSSAPVYPQLEEALLEGNLEMALEELGPEDPFIRSVLNGRSPSEVAKDAVEGSKLADPAFRKALAEGGEAAVQAARDPLIALARRIDPFDRQMIKRYEAEVESIEVPAGEKIGKARFAVYGKSEYPDATFTLRLSYGTVKGYPMNGTEAPPHTTFYGLYDRAYSFHLNPPYDLPPRYQERKQQFDLSTPLNFVSTCDIIGGNSGSPVINRNGELVGLIFDGNIESLVGDYVYSDARSRAVAVHSGAMIEALRKLYDAAPLADELEGKE